MAREDPQIKLRLSEELRDAIRDEADANGRSMNAEIVYRLENSLDPEYFGAEMNSLRQIYNQMNSRENNILMMLAQKQVLYVALDAEGIPISWPEVMTTLNAISNALDEPVDKIEAAVIKPDLVSSTKREEAWFALVDYFRALRAGRD